MGKMFQNEKWENALGQADEIQSYLTTLAKLSLLVINWVKTKEQHSTAGVSLIPPT